MQLRIFLAFCTMLAALPAQAGNGELSASKVFDLVSPSIVVVQAHDKSGAAIEMGSGVVIAKGIVVSNCHVFTKAVTATIQYKQQSFPAAILYGDMAHDLCSFTVKGLTAPAVEMGSTSQLKVGDPAFAVGAPEGLDLTLSGGLISSLRHIPGGIVLQVTTPISPGSSGGGLFDDHARLIGITAYYMKEGQQLNFALPVEWIKELPQRGRIARSSESPTTGGRISAVAATDADYQKGSRALLAGDYAVAAAILGPLATQGDARAQFDVGNMYYTGEGVSQNYATAAKWYRLAAQQGYADAQTNLGVLYGNGQGVSKDYAEAAKWYQLAANQGYALAQYNIGTMFAHGNGVQQGYAVAAMWFRKASAQGFVRAQDDLGKLYIAGQGVPQDYSQAITLLYSAADQGDADAQYNLGTMFFNGQGTSKDYAQAAALFLKAGRVQTPGATPRYIAPIMAW